MCPSCSLTKYTQPPSNEADQRLSHEAAFKLLVVCIQLEELAHRAKISFNILQIHLRTPPAPTFAPLVMSLLGVCAQVHSFCLHSLWQESDNRGGISGLYSSFRLAGNTEQASASLHLDAANRAGWDKILNRIHLADKSALAWMPLTLEHTPSEPLEGPAERATALTTEQRSQGDDEDLGEAV